MQLDTGPAQLQSIPPEVVTISKPEGSGALVWSCCSGWKNLMLQMRIYDKRYIMGHLWFEAKWSSGHLVVLSVWSGLVGSGLALVWSCGKTNQSLPVFLMYLCSTPRPMLSAPLGPWLLARALDEVLIVCCAHTVSDTLLCPDCHSLTGCQRVVLKPAALVVPARQLSLAALPPR
jgi:hypothetical protein